MCDSLHITKIECISRTKDGKLKDEITTKLSLFSQIEQNISFDVDFKTTFLAQKIYDNKYCNDTQRMASVYVTEYEVQFFG